MSLRRYDSVKKCVISGYYGFGNLGDEAILFALVRAFRSSFPGIDITVLSGNCEHTASSYGVKAADRWNPVAVWRALRGSDGLISGGGSLLQDVTGLASLCYYLGVMWLAILAGRPFWIHAQGIGPVRSRLGRFLVRLTLSWARGISVRDPESKDELVAMGLAPELIEVTVDPVLTLDREVADLQMGRRILEHWGVKGFGEEKIVGISVREWRGLTAYRLAIAEAAGRLVESGCSVVFLPFQYESDVAVCRDIIRMMNRPSSLVDEPLSVVEMASVIACLDLVIGMRLHALILGHAMGVPVVGISYDPKIDRFLASVGKEPAMSVEQPDGEVLIESVLSHR
ncbi:MAG: polysaccharide pyruvyl transferase CsaB [Syntrophothermus sp.]|uniref:polysaccharide pyruvyl transferase CsaB n=1 Tax=Syntrophothermus sp. TaxID=2736299 RepID=UPI00257DFEA6|nr:polysaccharide pyruvyl transferase CsaB [Syntrophothermus sp.]NSW82983.1 polysaccharide pyruvyl transferase CsaB [Syntrophothermus sp.]